MGQGFVVVMMPEWASQKLHFYDGISSMVSDWTRAHIFSDINKAIEAATALNVPCDVIEYSASLGAHVSRMMPHLRGGAR